MTNPSGSEPRSFDLRGLQESFPKTLAVVASCLYLLGFIVSWIYYSFYGILAIDLASPQYILVGAICLTIFGIFLWIDYLASRIASDFSSASWLKSVEQQPVANAFRFCGRCLAGLVGYWSGIFAGFLFSSLALLIIMGVLGVESPLSATTSKAGQLFGILTIFVLLAKCIAFCGVEFGRMMHPAVRQESLSKSRRSELLLWVIGLLLAGLTYLALYTFIVHRRMPASIGGGRPVDIQVCLRDVPERAPLRAVFALTDASAVWTRPLPLIRETSDSYHILIATNPNKLVVLRKGAADGAITIKALPGP